MYYQDEKPYSYPARLSFGFSYMGVESIRCFIISYYFTVGNTGPTPDDALNGTAIHLLQNDVEKKTVVPTLAFFSWLIGVPNRFR